MKGIKRFYARVPQFFFNILCVPRLINGHILNDSAKSKKECYSGITLLEGEENSSFACLTNESSLIAVNPTVYQRYIRDKKYVPNLRIYSSVCAKLKGGSLRPLAVACASEQGSGMRSPSTSYAPLLFFLVENTTKHLHSIK